MRRCCFLIVLAVTVLATASVSSAQVVKWAGAVVPASQVPADFPTATVAESGLHPTGPPPTDPAWGTTDYVTYTVGAADFVRRWSDSFNGTPDTTNMAIVMPAAGQTDAAVAAPVHLPTGAHLEYVRLMYHDNDTSNDPSLGLWSLDLYGPEQLVVSLAPGSFSGGNQYIDFSLDHTVTNMNQSYFVLAVLDRSGSTYDGIYGLTFWYHLQVSPAPATATFNDVPTNYWAFRNIEALASSGITAGCGGGNFCPEAPVTRAEMAVFLSAALGLHYPN